MGRQALYRKYRSQALDEVVGQEHVTEVLDAAIKAGKFSHAYLLTGPRGIGKTSVARIVAYLVNEIPYGEPTLDIIEIDAASHGLKEDVKDLIERASIAPTAGKYKVYIIDEVHSMKHDAFNTFLKLLEEPPEHVMFILATTDPQKLPATIISRAQRFHFRPVEPEKVMAHLKMIAKNEKISIDDEALELITIRGEGSMRDSISLLDQLGGQGKKITTKVVEDLLGLVPAEQIREVISGIQAGDIGKVSEVLRQFRREGLSPGVVVSQLNKALVAEGHYELVEKLLEAPKSADPWLKILAAIGQQVGNVKTKMENVRIKSENAKIENEKLIIAKRKESALVAKPKEAPLKATIKQVEEIKAEHKPKRPDPKRIDKSAPIEINWEGILAESKKLSEPCGAWIAHASYNYDGETLTLYFHTKLQRQKMKEGKCRQVLQNALISLYETPPAVEISDTPKPKSAAMAKVADIMGGGEVL